MLPWFRMNSDIGPSPSTSTTRCDSSRMAVTLKFAATMRRCGSQSFSRALMPIRSTILRQWLRRSKKLSSVTRFSPARKRFRNSNRIHGTSATHKRPWSFKHSRSVRIRQLHPSPLTLPLMKLRPFHSTSTRCRCSWRVIRTGVLSNMFGAARPLVGASAVSGLSRPKNVQCGLNELQPGWPHLWQPCWRCMSRH